MASDKTSNPIPRPRIGFVKNDLPQPKAQVQMPKVKPPQEPSASVPKSSEPK